MAKGLLTKAQEGPVFDLLPRGVIAPFWHIRTPQKAGRGRPSIAGYVKISL